MTSVAPPGWTVSVTDFNDDADHLRRGDPQAYEPTHLDHRRVHDGGGFDFLGWHLPDPSSRVESR